MDGQRHGSKVRRGLSLRSRHDRLTVPSSKITSKARKDLIESCETRFDVPFQVIIGRLQVP